VQDVLLAYVGSLAILLIAFAPLERRFPARPRQPLLRGEWKTDLAFLTGQYLVFTLASSALLSVLSRLSYGGIVGPWLSALRTAVRSLPLLVALFFTTVLGDLLIYWFHRACHRFDFLWRFHRVHHTAKTLDFLAAHREHPLDGLFTQLIQNLPLLLSGLPVRYLAGLVAFRGVWAVFIHSNIRLPLGPLRVLLGAPELHHYHHALDRKTGNYANLAPWLDCLFGTYVVAKEAYELGVPNNPPRSYWQHLLSPFKRG
jgi:sterol desaturase/sphingolipid hydroxylase (fatty acid hydroxylase superfamily)